MKRAEEYIKDKTWEELTDCPQLLAKDAIEAINQARIDALNDLKDIIMEDPMFDGDKKLYVKISSLIQLLIDNIFVPDLNVYVDLNCLNK